MAQIEEMSIKEYMKETLKEISNMVQDSVDIDNGSCKVSVEREIVKTPIVGEFRYQPEYTGWVDINIKLRIKEGWN